jgi:transcriptional regulator with XRE-family HTH domain
MNRKANGASIASLRQLVGISQRTLATRAGIAAPFLSQIEHGVRQPSPVVLRRLATELGVPLDAITSVVPEPEPEQAAS